MPSLRGLLAQLPREMWRRVAAVKHIGALHVRQAIYVSQNDARHALRMCPMAQIGPLIHSQRGYLSARALQPDLYDMVQQCGGHERHAFARR